MEYAQGKAPSCLLHSDDTIGAGVSTLVTTARAFYKEREPCIDSNYTSTIRAQPNESSSLPEMSIAVRVKCTNKSLTVELRTNEPFVGRIYAADHSEACGVQGHGSNVTRLLLNLPDTSDLDKAIMTCGLTPVYSVDQNNQLVLLYCFFSYSCFAGTAERCITVNEFRARY